MKGIRSVTICIIIVWLSIPVFAAEYKPGEVLVRFSPTAVIASAEGLDTSADRARIIAVDNTEQALRTLNNCADVAYAEPNYVIKAEELTPDDYGFDGPDYAQLRLPAAWDYMYTHPSSQPVVIAVVDSGVDLDHPELQDILVPGYDFANHDATPEDNSGHGTRVTGIMGSKGNNTTGIAGVCWNSGIRIMPLKFMEKKGSQTSGYLSDAVEAIRYAVDHGAHVINASWGFTATSQALAEAISYAEANGVLIICSAGNSGLDNDETPHYPSNYTHDNIIAVAALNTYGDLASFSNYGIYGVDLAAPGTGLKTTDLDGGFTTWASGTSFSAPFVTAAGALVMVQNPTLGGLEVRERLLQTTSMADEFSQAVVDTGGCLDVYNAITGENPHSIKSTEGWTPPSGQSADAGVSSEGGSSGGCFIDASDEAREGLALILLMLAPLLPVMRPRRKKTTPSLTARQP